MNCPNCGAPVSAGDRWCANCGAQVNVPQQPAVQQPVYQQPTPQQPVYQQSVQPTGNFSVNDLPPQYRPLSAWAYFGLTLLFSIPVVGFIFLIVYSCSSANINRRSFARSFWCWLIIAAIVFVILLLTGVLASISSNSSYLCYLS